MIAIKDRIRIMILSYLAYGMELISRHFEVVSAVLFLIHCTTVACCRSPGASIGFFKVYGFYSLETPCTPLVTV